jgi:NADH:ubiquinone oxidoreductase subunit E
MKKLDAPEKVIFICDGKKCCKYSKDIRRCFKEELKEAGLKKHVDLIYTDCTGNCKHAPVISIQPKNVWIGDLTEKAVSTIVKEYIK